MRDAYMQHYQIFLFSPSLYNYHQYQIRSLIIKMFLFIFFSAHKTFARSQSCIMEHIRMLGTIYHVIHLLKLGLP